MLMPPPPQDGWVSHLGLRLPVMIQQQKNTKAEKNPIPYLRCPEAAQKPLSIKGRGLWSVLRAQTPVKQKHRGGHFYRTTPRLGAQHHHTSHPRIRTAVLPLLASTYEHNARTNVSKLLRCSYCAALRLQQGPAEAV